MTPLERQARNGKLAIACEKLAATYDEDGSLYERAMRRLWLGFAGYYHLLARQPR